MNKNNSVIAGRSEAICFSSPFVPLRRGIVSRASKFPPLEGVGGGYNLTAVLPTMTKIMNNNSNK